MPAYNEEANIENVVNQLLSQTRNSYELDYIIVSSDGSTDRTIEILSKFDDNVVKVIDNRDRKGAAVRQNQVIDYAESDILLMINADIWINEKNFVDTLVQEVLNGADLVSPNMLCTQPNGFFETVVAFGMHLKNSAFENYRNGNNIYTCHGAARAFSKRLYKNFKFGSSIGEDAYSYLFAISKGYTYAYAGQTTFYIKCPSTFKDHLRQSTRNFNGMRILESHFDKHLVKKEFKLPYTVIIKSGINYLFKNPVLLVAYALTISTTFICSYFMKQAQVWEIAKSSKVINS